MKISYKHLVENIPSKPTIEDISKNLFQLGHEHEIYEDVFDMELTPNRGDCLSVEGILRDLAIFYEIKQGINVYENDIERMPFDFINNAKEACPRISFVKLEIEKDIKPYSGKLNDYFEILNIKKNNFFTDVSNFISYYTGQPTHCYDANKISGPIELNHINQKNKFLTLSDKEINLDNKNLVFRNAQKVINFAGIIGGKDTACSNETRSVLIECAYFKPESIIGKSIKYDVQSDAAHKFERGVDPLCHEIVIRKMLSIINQYAKIKSVKIYSEEYELYEPVKIIYDSKKINSIIGTSFSEEYITNFLSKLGFRVTNSVIEVPSYRHDVKTLNDIAEEIARSVGYDNIPASILNINKCKVKAENHIEQKLKSFLIDNSFYEVINNPFTSDYTSTSIKVDNPLDSNRSFLRYDLKQSLLNNLIYNQRRQKDSIKLFEISDIYSKNNKSHRVLGIIASGRVAKNYLDFSKIINKEYLLNMLQQHLLDQQIQIELISKEKIGNKNKFDAIYIEIMLTNINHEISEYIPLNNKPKNFVQYVPISEYPSSSRDISFSIKNFQQSKKVDELIKSLDFEILKDAFLFDYYLNENNNEIKMTYRFLFQSTHRTIIEDDVSVIMRSIMTSALQIDSVTIPGIDLDNKN